MVQYLHPTCETAICRVYEMYHRKIIEPRTLTLVVQGWQDEFERSFLRRKVAVNKETKRASLCDWVALVSLSASVKKLRNDAENINDND